MALELRILDKTPGMLHGKEQVGFRVSVGRKGCVPLQDYILDLECLAFGKPEDKRIVITFIFGSYCTAAAYVACDIAPSLLDGKRKAGYESFAFGVDFNGRGLVFVVGGKGFQESCDDQFPESLLVCAELGDIHSLLCRQQGMVVADHLVIHQTGKVRAYSVT